MITPELVRRFLHGSCTEEEKARLREYFTTHPEAWDQYLTPEEWETYEPTMLPDAATSERWWKRIGQRTGGASKTWRRMAAAAAVLLVAGLGWKAWTGRTKTTQTAQVATAGALRRQFNSGPKPVRYFMEDGSIVDLDPGSEIRYQEPFTKGGRRIVYLSGGASFEAANDPAHPLSVYSGVLETRVLGTTFTIESFDQAPYIKVLLHTGKVRVSRPSSTDVYLLPGQELWYNKASMLATVHRPRRREILPARGGADSLARGPDWYMFNNQSLAQVFDQLSEMYDVKIRYSEADVHGLYFIARFEKADSLEEIMRDIALLNGLRIRKQDNAYIVSKKIH
jgi:ferric-dicitrate binding protein FerR (iron transport regulator)